MADTEHSIIHRRVCTIYTQHTDDVLDSGRRVFRALGPCPLWHEPDERTGIEVGLTRRAVLFSRWHVNLPEKRIFLTREMMGL